MKKNGFTLLEVLVALAVLAIALAAVIKASGYQADNTAYLRDKTFAHWVALNVINQTHIQHTFPKQGQYRGKERMGKREWYWQLVVSETLDPQLRKWVVSVYRYKNDESAVTSLTTYASILSTVTREND